MTKAAGAKLLVEHSPSSLQILEERTTPTGSTIMVVEGEYARADRATANKRKYPRKIMEAQVKRLNKALEERRVLGELDHPADGRTMLQRVSHVLTSLRLGEDNVIIGRSEILDTARGKDLQALLKAKCKVGVSSRGFGTTVANSEGEEVVQEDYNLETFDFVYNPADQDAFPEVVENIFEGAPVGTLPSLMETQAPVSAAPVVESVDREKLASELRQKFAAEMMEKTAEIKASVREEVLQECLSDPKVAGALSALTKVREALRPFGGIGSAAVEGAPHPRVAELEAKVEEQQQTIKELNDQLAAAETRVEEYAHVAREAGYNLYIERELSLDPDGELIRRLVGEVMSYPSLEMLEARVSGVREELLKYRQEEELRQESKRKEEEERSRKIEEERVRNAREVAELRAQLSESLQKLQTITTETRNLATENDQLRAKVYAEQRIAATKSSPRMRDLVNENKPKSESEVDRILENHRETPVVADAQGLAEAKERVRSFQRRPSAIPTALDEAQASPPPPAPGKNGSLKEGLSLLGTSIGEIDRLSDNGRM